MAMARPDEIALADELRRLANMIDPPQIAVLPETREAAAEAMRAAADAMQYGEKAKQEAHAEYHAKVMELNDRASKLLCIENRPTVDA
jgi:tRNA U34 5-carboxymethylaminomethyl modifying enzyme MnmG/GidA